jgi:hypothetical protein
MKKIIPIILCAIVFAIFLAFTPVLAEEENKEVELTPEQIGLIYMNCNSAKSQLKRLQTTDARIRVNLGSDYNTLLTGFMTNLNIRLVKNNIKREDLIANQSDFSTAVDKFKEDYISYSQALDETIATSCKTDPDKFYRELEKTRAAKKKLNEDYKKTNEILNQHKAAVKELMESL